MIEVNEITKSYTGEICLNNISLRINKGEFVSVMGESGSGKTTLLEILVGVRSPDSGSVTVLGEDIHRMSEEKLAKFRRTKIGVVYQNFALIPTLTAEENICLPLLLEHVQKAEIDRRVKEITAELRVDKLLKKYPSELSGGQQQRIAIARAVAIYPEVLFLDEPTGSLDSVNAERVMRFLSSYSRNTGCTVVQITHSENAAKGTKIIRIKDGAVIQ